MFTCLLYYRNKKELQDNPFAEAKFQNKGEKNYAVRKNLSNMAIFRILRSDTSKSRKSNVFFPVKINLTNKNSFFLIYSQFHWLTKDFPDFPWSDFKITDFPDSVTTRSIASINEFKSFMHNHNYLAAWKT